MSNSDDSRSLRARLSSTPIPDIDSRASADWDAETRKSMIARRISDACIPEMYRSADTATCCTHAWLAAEGIVSGHVLNVVIAGAAGDGKTHTACAILSHVLRCRPMLGTFAVEPDVFREMRASYGSKTSEDDVLCRYAAPRLLVLDDLGRSKHTDRTLEMLWSLINRRYSARRPTIFTTQYDRDGLAERFCAGGGDSETAQAIVRRVLDDGRAMLFRAVRPK